jgi:hypothetical protein
MLVVINIDGADARIWLPLVSCGIVCATIFVVWFAKMGETFIGKILGMQQYHSGIKPTYM